MDFTVSFENLQPEKSGVFISITSLWVLKGNLKGCKGLEIVGVRQVKKGMTPPVLTAHLLLSFKKVFPARFSNHAHKKFNTVIIEITPPL